MFSQATILIDREPKEVYTVLVHMKTQLTFWEQLIIPKLKLLDDDANEIEGAYSHRYSTSPCVISIHKSRPGAGLVTRIQSAMGELAAEWRVMEDGERTKVEINIEGHGGGFASNINVRQIAPRILKRLKQYFDRS